MFRRAPWLAVVLLAQALIDATPAHAEGDAEDKAAELFEEGRRLLDEGRPAEACPKLAESQRLDPAPGTALNIGRCHEALGRTETARRAFAEATTLARRAGDTARAEEAERRAQALEVKLSKILVVLGDKSRIEGLTVLLDGSLLGPALWGTAVPVDPGEHTVEATAPGRRGWKTTVQLGGPGIVNVTVPLLEPEPSIVPPVPAKQGMSGPRIGGIVVGGIGLAAIGAGVGLAVAAAKKDDESKQYCPTEYTKCYASGVSLRNEAITLADTSTVVTILGGVVVGTGVALFILGKAPGTPEQPAKAWVMPMGGPKTAGLVAGGAW